jgi:hypothetical protein
MEKNKWTYEDKPNVMIITTKNIVRYKSEILSVWHDDDDGMLQFLDGTYVNDDDAMIVSLEQMVNIDNYVKEVLDIPLGWVAWREKKNLDGKGKSNVNKQVKRSMFASLTKTPGGREQNVNKQESKKR